VKHFVSGCGLNHLTPSKCSGYPTCPKDSTAAEYFCKYLSIAARGANPSPGDQASGAFVRSLAGASAGDRPLAGRSASRFRNASRITRAFTLSRTTEWSLHRMARKPNYDFEKRRKEQDRMARTDAKRAERQQRRDQRQAEEAPAPTDPAPDEEQPGIVPPAV
jgi:hypothetical protein